MTVEKVIWNGSLQNKVNHRPKFILTPDIFFYVILAIIQSEQRVFLLSVQDKQIAYIPTFLTNSNPYFSNIIQVFTCWPTAKFWWRTAMKTHWVGAALTNN